MEPTREDLVLQKDRAYAERNQLVAALSKVFPSYLAQHPAEDRDWEDDWRTIVFIDLPTGQVSWHIHEAEKPLFAHLETQENRWDGHGEELKRHRLGSLEKRWE